MIIRKQSPSNHATPSEALITAAVLAVLAVSVPAQRQLDELRKRGLPVDSDHSLAVAYGDVDGDGDLDLVFGNDDLGSYGPQNRLYLNDGTGTYADGTAARLPVDTDLTYAVALGDVDGDSDLDIVFGNLGQNRLYLNDGTGAFADATKSRLPVDGDPTQAIVMGDVDGDGDLDLVLGNGNPYLPGLQNRVYLNNGTGIFSDNTGNSMPAIFDQTRAVALGDVDGDGDLDMVFGNGGLDTVTGSYHSYSGHQNRVYLNNGTGVFSDATQARIPVDIDRTSAVAMADVEGDGDLDIVFGNHLTKSLGQNRLYLNDGTGTFADATATRMPDALDDTQSVVVCDVDSDGDSDLIFGNGGAKGGQNRLYLNDGSGGFKDATVTNMPLDLDNTHAVVCCDVDGDGDFDQVLASFDPRPFFGQQNRLLLNDGSGTYTDSTGARMPVGGWGAGVAPGDIDGDGDIDLVFGNSGYPGQQNQLYLNDGKGTFTDATAARIATVSDRTYAVALGDVDGDSDLDIVFANRRQNQLYLNDGNGHFSDATAAKIPTDNDHTTALALGDVDGDGDLDIVFGNYLKQNRLYLNDGTGIYTDTTGTRLPTDKDSASAVALADVDGDGDTDLFCGNSGYYGQQNRLYLNDGMGKFVDATSSHLPAATRITNSVVLGDIDGDGDVDIVCGNGAPFLGWEQNRLYLNDGKGTFLDATSARMPVNQGATFALSACDIDNDGDTDIFLGNAPGLSCAPTRSGVGNCALVSVGGRNGLYLNDGDGFFTDASDRLPAIRNVTYAAATCDADGDGDADIVFGNEGQNVLYLNLLRQLDAPLRPRIGHTYTLEAYARYGLPRLVDIALPYLSSATANIPLPIGTVGIDPTQMIALPPFIIPQPAGVGSISLTVPNLPSLVGGGLYAQALLLRYPLDERLTNVTADVIIR